MARSYKWETGRSMHVGQACAHGPTNTTDCATAVDRSDESEPTTWKLIHFVIELFKSLRKYRLRRRYFPPES